MLFSRCFNECITSATFFFYIFIPFLSFPCPLTVHHSWNHVSVDWPFPLPVLGKLRLKAFSDVHPCMCLRVNTSVVVGVNVLLYLNEAIRSLDVDNTQKDITSTKTSHIPPLKFFLLGGCGCAREHSWFHLCHCGYCAVCQRAEWDLCLQGL